MQSSGGSKHSTRPARPRPSSPSRRSIATQPTQLAQRAQQALTQVLDHLCCVHQLLHLLQLVENGRCQAGRQVASYSREAGVQAGRQAGVQAGRQAGRRHRHLAPAAVAARRWAGGSCTVARQVGAGTPARACPKPFKGAPQHGTAQHGTAHHTCISCVNWEAALSLRCV